MERGGAKARRTLGDLGAALAEIRSFRAELYGKGRLGRASLWQSKTPCKSKPLLPQSHLPSSSLSPLYSNVPLSPLLTFFTDPGSYVHSPWAISFLSVAVASRWGGDQVKIRRSLDRVSVAWWWVIFFQREAMVESWRCRGGNEDLNWIEGLTLLEAHDRG